MGDKVALTFSDGRGMRIWLISISSGTLLGEVCPDCRSPGLVGTGLDIFSLFFALDALSSTRSRKTPIASSPKLKNEKKYYIIISFPYRVFRIDFLGHMQGKLTSSIA
jgi:hypothetical protein